MSKKNGFSRFEAMTPIVRLLPPAKLRAWRFGWCFRSSMALRTRARVDFSTNLVLFTTRETVAVETPACRATCLRFMPVPLLDPAQSVLRLRLEERDFLLVPPVYSNRLMISSEHKKYMPEKLGGQGVP